MKVLIADDSKSMRQMLQGTLEEVGYEVIVTENGQQAGASDYICKPFHPDELLARLKAGERIVNMQMQLSHMQKMDAIGHLAAGIAHEINTPLQYIKNNTCFIQDVFDDMVKLTAQYNRSQSLFKENMKYLNEEVPRAIKESLEGLEHITKIVSAMKEFASPGAQKKQ